MTSYFTGDPILEVGVCFQQLSSINCSLYNSESIISRTDLLILALLEISIKYTVRELFMFLIFQNLSFNNGAIYTYYIELSSVNSQQMVIPI